MSTLYLFYYIKVIFLLLMFCLYLQLSNARIPGNNVFSFLRKLE